MIIFVAWIVVLILIFIKHEKNVILYIPLIYILFEITSQLITITEYSRYLILLRYSLIFYFIFISLFNIFKRKKSYINSSNLSITIFLFIALLIIQSLLNSYNHWDSFKKILPIITSFLIFLGLYLRSDLNIKHCNIVFNQLLLYLFIFCLNTIIFSYFLLGGNNLLSGSYAPEFLRLGTFVHTELHGFAIGVSLFPVLIKVSSMINKNRIFITLIAIVTTSILFLTFKRAYFIALATGFLVYFLFNLNIKQLNILRIVTYVLSLVIIFFTLNLGFEYLKAQRGLESGITEFTESNRALEYTTYPTELKKHEEPIRFFILGENLFLETEGLETLKTLTHAEGLGRNLHTDFTLLLYGSGVVGITIYFFIFFNMLRFLFKLRPLIIDRINILIHIGTLILVTNVFIGGFSDGILYLNNRLVPLYLMGAFLSINRNYALKIGSQP